MSSRKYSENGVANVSQNVFSRDAEVALRRSEKSATRATFMSM
jgi:hypothetical protein